jgi:hypothetical protein
MEMKPGRNSFFIPELHRVTSQEGCPQNSRNGIQPRVKRASHRRAAS